MKNFLKHKVLFSLAVILLAGIIGLISTIVTFSSNAKDTNYVSATIEFCYDGASEGLDPLGNTFNPVGLLNDEVISSALLRAELSEKYSVSAVKSNLYMTGSVPSSTLSQITTLSGSDSNTALENYHPTKYTLSFYTNTTNKIAKNDAITIVNALVSEYKNAFVDAYTNSLDFSNVNYALQEDNDYLLQLEITEAKLNMISNYATTLSSKHSDFTSKEGTTFSELVLQINTLKNNEVKKAKQNALLNGLSTDATSLKSYYEYQIQTLNYEKAQYTKDLTSVNTTLASYNKDSTVYIGAGDSVVKLEGNSSKTYDTLVNKQLEINNKIADINAEIDDYESKIDDIENASGDASDLTRLQNSINSINSQVATIETSFNNLLDEYNEEYVNNNALETTNATYHKQSMASASFVVQFVKSCGPIVTLALLGLSIYFFILAIKKEKSLKN